MSEIMLKNVELKVEETKSSTETTRDPPVAPIVSSATASNPPVAPIVKSSTASNPPVAPIISSSRASNPPVAPIVKSSTASNPPVAPIVSSSTASINETTPTTPHRGCREVEIASQPRRFALSELIIATKNFRREYLLGVGGFGPVYKGWINETGSSPVKPGSGLPVAVKTLNRHGLQGHREWMAEVHFLRNLRHENLVKLVGYCMEGQQRLIVYELMARGSLEHHLFRRSILPWSIRMKITLGAAKGLVYLHEEIQKPVIFRDFKASNILLDVDYNAKLSDFGLARHGPEGDKTHVSTRVMGTNGYAAPEYLMTGHLTVKSDVYSFGVVLLEILSGRKAIDKSRRVGERCLVSWAKPYLRDRHHFWRIIDPHLGGHFSKKGALKATEIASLCLRSNPKHRPQMSQVVEMLMRLPSTSEIGGADVDTNSNNVEARVVAKDKHVAGSLYSPTGSNASSANYTLTNKQKGKLPVYT